MKKLTTLFCLLAGSALAQSSPGFLTSQVLTAAQLNTSFQTKLNYPASFGTLGNATATGFSAANQALFLSGTLAGAGTGPYSVLGVTDMATNTTVGTAISSLQIGHTFGAGSGAGNRNALQVILNMTAAVPGTNDTLNAYGAIATQAYTNSNVGGTSMTPHGQWQAGGDVAFLKTGATFWHYLQGREIDVTAQTGTSVAYKHALNLVEGGDSAGDDQTAGSVDESMLAFDNDNASNVGFGRLIEFGRPDSFWPAKSTATLIGANASNSMTAAIGIDFSNVTFSTDFLKSANFTVDPTGKISAQRLTVTTSSPAWLMNDTGATPTTGGLVRFSGNSSGTYLYQINTAAGADFSSALTVYSIAATGNTVYVANVTAPSFITVPVAFGSLPGSPVAGQRAAVNNTNVCTFMTGVNGSGALFCPVVYTGSAWVGG